MSHEGATPVAPVLCKVTPQHICAGAFLLDHTTSASQSPRIPGPIERDVRRRRRRSPLRVRQAESHKLAEVLEVLPELGPRNLQITADVDSVMVDHYFILNVKWHADLLPR